MTAKSFTEFHFSSELIRALERLNYKKPTKVQSKVIPLVLANRDVVVKSQTGSGKTASYGIPICELLNWEENKPQALILTPTRELAVQVKDDINNIGRFKRIKAAAVYGKQPIAIQKTELKQKTHAVVGTPGRVFDLIERGYLNVDRIRYLVIDEADEMLDMGFIDQVEAIINRLPGERVTMLFSATFPPELKNIASLYMRNPIDIEIEETSIAAPKIKHSLYWSEENEKFVLLMDVTILENPDSCIIFCRTKDRVDEVHNFLRKKGYPCDKIHGDLKQERRLAVMDQFRKGAFRYLIATDVAARGIDIDNISLVINFDIPYDKESYVHRTGRTGRAGKSGEAISFVTEDEEGYLNEIEEYLGFEISVKTLPPREDIIKMKPTFEATMKTAPARKKAKNEQLNKEIMKLYFNGGKKKKLRAVDFVGTITNIDGINAEDIGVIAITDSATFIDILNGKGPLVLREMKNRTVKGKQLKVHEARD